MRYVALNRPAFVAFSALVVGLLAWPTAGAAQTATGQATAVEATVSGLSGVTTTALASTGALSGPDDARQASLIAGAVPALLTSETLHATSIGSPERVASEASVAGLALSVAGTAIGADFVMGRAFAPSNGSGLGSSSISNLRVNGVPVAVTGEPNQTVSIPAGTMVINEQSSSLASSVVNALHITVPGVADVVVGSATARID